MKSCELENAIEVRDDYESIIEFLSGYLPAETEEVGWRGKVTLSFGSYACDLSADIREELIGVLDKQRFIYLRKLREWGVDYFAELEETPGN